MAMKDFQHFGQGTGRGKDAVAGGNTGYQSLQTNKQTSQSNLREGGLDLKKCGHHTRACGQDREIAHPWVISQSPSLVTRFLCLCLSLFALYSLGA